MSQKLPPGLTMIPNALATQAGLLPIRRGPIRFAVGPPNGLTSNSWRIWTTKNNDIYIACRDNFKEAKVSLHASGRWRMAFTEEAVAQNSDILLRNQNRAWDIWDEPPASLPGTVIAFRIVFPSAELAVRPEQRAGREWNKVIFIEPARQGKLAMVTVFVTVGAPMLTHASGPSFCLASLRVGENRYAQIIAHEDPEGNFPELVERCVAEARREMESACVGIPPDSYGYFFGHLSDGSRFLVGARMSRPTS